MPVTGGRVSRGKGPRKAKPRERLWVRKARIKVPVILEDGREESVTVNVAHIPLFHGISLSEKAEKRAHPIIRILAMMFGVGKLGEAQMDEAGALFTRSKYQFYESAGGRGGSFKHIKEILPFLDAKRAYPIETPVAKMMRGRDGLPLTPSLLLERTVASVRDGLFGPPKGKFTAADAFLFEHAMREHEKESVLMASIHDREAVKRSVKKIGPVSRVRHMTDFYHRVYRTARMAEEIERRVRGLVLEEMMAAQQRGGGSSDKLPGGEIDIVVATGVGHHELTDYLRNPRKRRTELYPSIRKFEGKRTFDEIVGEWDRYGFGYDKKTEGELAEEIKEGVKEKSRVEDLPAAERAKLMDVVDEAVRSTRRRWWQVWKRE
jgi:hypothetical protein